MRMSPASELQDWLKRIESFHSAEIELGLERVRAVAEKLDCLHFSCPVITVAGTNGKGSCVEFITQIALEHGLRVGTYTSPHLFEFNERIRVNGIQVGDERLVEAFEIVEQHRHLPLSFFEFTTLTALKIFQASQLDLLVLEVGLGGRLDAVNIIDADVAVICSIGIDHEAWLGNTREQIAIEKAGIARFGKSCVVNETQLPSTLKPALQHLGAQGVFVGEDFSGHYAQNNERYHIKVLTHTGHPEQLELEVNRLTLAPENCLAAIQAIFLSLGESGLQKAKIYSACYRTRLPGRFQILDKVEIGGELFQGKVVCDLTHNPAGAVFFVKQLDAYLKHHGFKRVTALCGFMADKDIKGILQHFIGRIDACLLTDLPLARAARADDINRQHLPDGFVACKTFSSPEHTLKHFFANAHAQDLLIIFGSFHTVEPCLKFLSEGADVGIKPIKS